MSDWLFIGLHLGLSFGYCSGQFGCIPYNVPKIIGGGVCRQIYTEVPSSQYPRLCQPELHPPINWKDVRWTILSPKEIKSRSAVL